MKYKYHTSNKAHQEMWLCANCKKSKMDTILTGKLKLIDQSSNPSSSCDVCGGVGSMVAQEGSHLSAV